MSYADKSRGSQGLRSEAHSAHPTPGKQTLVEQIAAQVVQQREVDLHNPSDEATVHAAASRGVATPASPLPFSDTLQRAFGRHDVSSIRAHTGAEAAASAQAMGADAYATGDHVVLGRGADLHTVAHEAAHVIQQRGGVQLKGGVGAVGDPYEHHADAVAGRVVAVQSAEDLLDHGAASGGPRTAEAIQRKEGKDDAKLLENQAGLKGTDVEIPALQRETAGDKNFKLMPSMELSGAVTRRIRIRKRRGSRAGEIGAIKDRLLRTAPDEELRIKTDDLHELVRLLTGVDDAIVAAGIADPHWRVPAERLEELAKRVPAMDLKTERSLDDKTHALAEVMINAVSIRNFLSNAVDAGCVVVLG